MQVFYEYLSIRVFSCFKGGMWEMVVIVADHCLSF